MTSTSAFSRLFTWIRGMNIHNSQAFQELTQVPRFVAELWSIHGDTIAIVKLGGLSIIVPIHLLGLISRTRLTTMNMELSYMLMSILRLYLSWSKLECIPTVGSMSLYHHCHRELQSSILEESPWFQKRGDHGDTISLDMGYGPQTSTIQGWVRGGFWPSAFEIQK